MVPDPKIGVVVVPSAKVTERDPSQGENVLKKILLVIMVCVAPESISIRVGGVVEEYT